METFVRVTERKRLIKLHGRIQQEKPSGNAQLPSDKTEEEKGESGDYSEPDHDFWAHDADRKEYRTNNTLAQGYHDPYDEEFTFYKKKKGPESEEPTDEYKTEERDVNYCEEKKEGQWY